MKLLENIRDLLVQGRILPRTPVYADALVQHNTVAEHLGIVLKSLVTTAGETVREDDFHPVNTYHSTLKGWINVLLGSKTVMSQLR